MPFRRKRQVNPDFMPIFFSDLNFTDAQRLICENNPECLLDFHATNDTEVAMTTLNSQKEVKAIIDLLGNCHLKMLYSTARMYIGVNEQKKLE